jgi:hypothetical protein
MYTVNIEQDVTQRELLRVERLCLRKFIGRKLPSYWAEASFAHSKDFALSYIAGH